MPQRGFQGEDAEKWRLHMANGLTTAGARRSNAHANGADQSGAPNQGLLSRLHKSIWYTAATRDDKPSPSCALSSAKTPFRDSLFAREPEYCRHVCVLYLLLVLLVGFRMASEPSRLVSERLARAKAMNA
jgi:hypothetical protein